MSARPRFVVTSVTGFPEVAFGGKPGTKYQVLDRPYCYATVFETPHESAAKRLAQILNAEQWDYAEAYMAKVLRQRVNGKTYRGRHRWKRGL